jgi:competence protein ComEC
MTNFTTGKIKDWSLIILILINFVIFYAVFAEDREGKLRVIFLDIGQGDAIFIESPNGNQVLVDSGPDKNIINALNRIMPFYDKSIDAVIVTHPDQDHIGGLPEILKNYSVGKYFNNGMISDTGTFKEITQEIKRINSDASVGAPTEASENTISEVLMEGETLDLGDGVYLKILYPNKKPSGTDTNKYSIVAKLYYGDSDILLTGDIPTDVEKYLAMTEGEELDSDILKVAHHGSKNSLSPEFFSAVFPEYSIISASKDNSFGHPHKEIIDALNNIGTNILRTYEMGDITFVSDGGKIAISR